MIRPEELLYLDNNATTAIDPAVLESMRPFLEEFFANPSSGYGFAAQVREAIEEARQQVADLLGCEGREITFTSGGTEPNNTAYYSALDATPDRRQIVSTPVEHSAVLPPVSDLEYGG